MPDSNRGGRSDNPSTPSASNGGPRGERQHTERHAVFHISVVAQMVETHPQTLRTYERMGLVSPQRVGNNVRLYTEEDIERVRRIQHLTQDLGVNLAGVEVVFKLLREIDRMRAEIERLEGKTPPGTKHKA